MTGRSASQPHVPQAPETAPAQPSRREHAVAALGVVVGMLVISVVTLIALVPAAVIVVGWIFTSLLIATGLVFLLAAWIKAGEHR